MLSKIFWFASFIAILVVFFGMCGMLLVEAAHGTGTLENVMVIEQLQLYKITVTLTSPISSIEAPLLGTDKKELVLRSRDAVMALAGVIDELKTTYHNSSLGIRVSAVHVTEVGPAEPPAPADESEDYKTVSLLDLDEYTIETLRGEIVRRELAHQSGLCDYCNCKLQSTPVCKFPNRHNLEARLRTAMCAVVAQIIRCHNVYAGHECNDR